MYKKLVTHTNVVVFLRKGKGFVFGSKTYGRAALCQSNRSKVEIFIFFVVFWKEFGQGASLTGLGLNVIEILEKPGINRRKSLGKLGETFQTIQVPVRPISRSLFLILSQFQLGKHGR